MSFVAGRHNWLRDTAGLAVLSLTSDSLGAAMELVTVHKAWPTVAREQRFRLTLCGHKALEAGAVCLVLMVQGNLTAVTLAHLLIACKTGFLAVSPALAITFSPYARHFVNRWTASGFLGVCTLLADAIVHHSHYPGEYTEALLTGLGAFLFSVIISFTPLGERIDRLGEVFLHSH